MFIDINGWSWSTSPSVDDAEQAVLAVASGDWGLQEMQRWLRDHISPLAA
jgi:hypothetical protein